jgi:NAD(P)-dependent dehydrogenase (short-subunit alcohol dehydrogenase family)/uncharacterized OB-fold protein
VTAPVVSADWPPAVRGRCALHLTAAAARGRFELQVCERCSAVQYPPREVCVRCLSDRLRWTQQDGVGTVLAITTLTHSNAGYFQARLPWHLGLVQLRAGPTVMVHLHGAITTAPAPVRVIARLDRSGQGVLIGMPANPKDTLEGDAMMQEMGCDPRSRRILISDGESDSGLALVQALLAAGAAKVWVGHSGCLESVAVPAGAPRVAYVPLDLKRADSAQSLAQVIGGEVDILIHNHDVQLGNAGGASLAAATTEMEINYFGLLRLAQAFAPMLRQRARQGPACAWVNLLSVAALSGYLAQSTYCASKAAAHSFTQGLRAQLQPDGVRVISVFAGPLDAAALADAIVTGLRDGIEDLYPGDVAQSWLQGLRDDPKVWERELAAAVRPS